MKDLLDEHAQLAVYDPEVSQVDEILFLHSLPSLLLLLSSSL
jgi:hypothetical protein